VRRGQSGRPVISREVRDLILKMCLLPDPFNRDLSQQIDLAAGKVPSCTLQLDERCLLVLHHIEYPWPMLKSGTTGKVILTGTISPEGTVLDVQVAAADASPPTGKDALAEAAAGNLRMWRFREW